MKNWKTRPKNKGFLTTVLITISWLSVLNKSIGFLLKGGMSIGTLRFPRNKQMEQIFDDKANGADGSDVSEKVSALIPLW